MKSKAARILSILFSVLVLFASCGQLGDGGETAVTINLPYVAGASRAIDSGKKDGLIEATRSYRVHMNDRVLEGTGGNFSSYFMVGLKLDIYVECLNSSRDVIVRTGVKSIIVASGGNSVDFNLMTDGNEITPPAPPSAVTEYINITFNQGFVYTNTVHQSPNTWQAMAGATLPNSGQREKGSSVSADQATATGYVFKGWVESNVQPSGDAPDTQSFNYVQNYDSDMTLYAIWEQIEPGSHSVKFAGGTTTGSSASGLPQGFQQKEGTQATFSGTPTCPGYEFAGWNADVAGVTVTQQGNGWEFTMPTSDVTLTAQWNVITYTLSYEANDGQATPAQTETFTIDTGTANVTLKAANTFTRTGYTFANWSAGGSNSYNPSTDISKTSLMALAVQGSDTTHYNVTLTAQWTINSYSVTVSAGNGVQPSDVQNLPSIGQKEYNATVQLGTEPTRTGYTFTGWQVTPNTLQISGNGNDRSFTMPAQAITLTAQWTPITYTVRYNKNANDATGTMTDSSHTYGVSATLTANAFSRTNYTFTGWATSTTGSKTYNDSASVSNLKNVQGEVMDLYAVWSPVQYTITYSANGGTGNASTTGATTSFNIETPSITLAAEGTLEKIAYQFAGWETTDGKNTDVSNMNAAQLIALITSGDTLALQVKWIDGKRTVLYPDGTFIINELPNARRQDTPTAVYAAMKDDGSNYVFSDSGKVLWSNNKTLITSVEIGSDIAPTSTSQWFYSMSNCTSMNLASLDTSKVTTMSYMFQNCFMLTSLGVSNFDTSRVTDMAQMFDSCSKLTTIYASDSFVTSRATTYNNMFSRCSKLVGGQNTAYDANNTDKTFARIDNPPDALGYFTQKP